MNREYTEIPQVDIPDEVTQVELPEIVENTPHPDPTSPQASGSGQSRKAGAIGFVKKP